MQVGALEIKLFADVARIQSDMAKATRTVDGAMRGIEKSVNIAKSAFLGITGGASLAGIARISDSYKKFDSQLKLATNSVGEYNQAYSETVRIARQSQSALEGVGVLYARISNNLRDFGATQKEVSKITETVTSALRVSNATTQESASVMLQLSQAFGAGRLNGQEFSAIAENAPLLLRELARSMGVTYGALKQMGAEGKITGEELKKAFTNEEFLNGLREQVKQVGTISSAFTVFKNNLTQYIGEADKANGASRLISQGVILLGDSIGVLANVALVALIAKFGQFASGIGLKIEAMKAATAQNLLSSRLEIEQSILTREADRIKTAQEIANNTSKATSKVRLIQARLAEAESSLAAVVGTAKEGAALKILEAQTYSLIKAKGALAVASGATGVAMSNNASATTKLVTQWQQAEEVNKKLNASVSIGTKVMGAFNSVISFLGGPLGAVITALGLGYLAFNKISDIIENKTIPSFRKYKDELQKVYDIEVARKNLKLGADDKLVAEKKDISDLETTIKSTKETLDRLKSEQNRTKRYGVDKSEDIAKTASDLKFYNEKLQEQKTALMQLQSVEDARNSKALKDKYSTKNYAPNFSAGVEAQDIDKIHKIQEESAKANKQNYDSQRKVNQDLYNEKLALLQSEIAEETENQDMISSYKQEKLEEFNKEYLKSIQDSIDEEFELNEAASKVKQELIEKEFKFRQDELEKLAKKEEELAKDISKSLTDALLRGFESGKGFAKNFRDTLINMFKTLVLRPTIDAILAPITGGLASIFSGGAAGEVLSGKGSGSIFGQLSSIGDIFKSGNALIDGSIQSLAGKISGFGFDKLGASIFQNSAVLSKLVPFAGAALSLLTGDIKGAIGAGIGAALSFTPLGPLGGIVGSFIGKALGGLFGGSTPKRNWAQVLGNAVNGDFSVKSTFSKRDGNAAISPLTELSKAFAQQLGGFLKEFGIDSNINTVAAFSTRPTKKTKAAFGGDVNGAAFGAYGLVYGKKDSAAFQKFIDTALGTVLVQAIKASTLSDGVKKFFNELTKKEDVSDAIGTLSSLNKALLDLPTVFNAVRNAIDTTSYETSIADLKAQFAAIGTYTSLFYSAEEQFATFTKQLTTQFTALGIAVPSSRDAFRALVDGITVVDDATRNQFNGLIALAPAADAYFKSLQAQADGINQVNQALADGLDKNLYSNYADFVSAQASTSAGVNAASFVSNASASSGDNALALQVASLKEQGASQQSILEAIAQYLYNMEKIYRQWNGDGLPETRPA